MANFYKRQRLKHKILVDEDGKPSFGKWSFDKENRLITVEAGIKLSELLNFTLKHDLWLPQVPGYPTITIGGAVATNAHGKSCGYHGTIRKQIKKIFIFVTSFWSN